MWPIHLYLHPGDIFSLRHFIPFCFQVPSILVVQLPRSGMQKMFKRIKLNPFLDISRVMSSGNILYVFPPFISNSRVCFIAAIGMNFRCDCNLFPQVQRWDDETGKKLILGSMINFRYFSKICIFFIQSINR